MTLPEKIKALPSETELARSEWANKEVAYEIGFYHAKLAAATLAAEHEARAQALADALEAICTELADDDELSAKQIARHAGSNALRAWKESQ